MAEGAVASAAQKLSELLGQLLFQEATFLRGVRDDVEWLQSQLRWMESFMKDADAKRRKGDERVKNWVREVREIAYQAEDIVDTFILKIDSRRGAATDFFRRYACIPPDLIALHDIGNKILRIRSKVESIRVSREAYGIVHLGESSGGGLADESLLPWRQVSPHLDDDMVIVGFDLDTKLILKRVLDSHVTRRCVVSIVGMGGLGKTTLATKVYNSNDVQSHFSACVWITVSQDCIAKELLKDIINKVIAKLSQLHSVIELVKGILCKIVMGLEKKRVEDMMREDEILRYLFERLKEDELKSCLYELLRDRKYFVVLDDVWEQQVWEQIKAAFPNGNNGSRVLLTTRFMVVAKAADPSIAPYELPFLNERESWELFLKKVFPAGREEVAASTFSRDLEELGKKLVKRCDGLPLAIVALGGLLSRTNPNINAWRELAENIDWGSTRDGEQCLQIIAMSYHYLPHHFLKSCFLYLGCFPEDYIIKASEVTNLWIAEGFIPQKDNRTLEETAKGYMDELVHRCMVQVVDRTSTTRRVKSFRLHDLFRDLCILEARQDCFLRIYTRNSNSADREVIASRRLVLHDVSGSMFGSSSYKARATLGFHLYTADVMFLRNFIHSCNLLRVIHLSFASGVALHKSGLPKQISSLIHLRNITLRCPSLRYIPSSIGKLGNLQTLDVRGTSICELPETIHKIETLRHLYTSKAFIVHSSSAIGSLRNMQTLKSVNAGNWIKKSLTKLSSLRKLAISQVTVTQGTALADSLCKLDQLTSLYLQTEQTIPAASIFTSSKTNQQHLYKLTLVGAWSISEQLPQNLISLTLTKCKVDRDAIAAISRLPSLVNLKLHECENADAELSFSRDGFRQLQNLELAGFTELKTWRVESGAMPNITHLKIEKCSALEMLPDGFEQLSSLQKLVVEKASQNLLKRITTDGEDQCKIRHIRSIIVDGKPL